MLSTLAGVMGADIIIWKPSSDGVFSTASAWELICVKFNNFHGLDWI